MTQDDLVPPKTIEDLLHRRTDLSTFLIHLTKDTPGGPVARDNLLSIASTGSILARSPFGPAKDLDSYLAATGATQRAVCFTETPLEHAWMMVEEITGRQERFQPYGIAITKTTGRKSHVNPVWYTDITTRGGRDWPAKGINELVTEAKDRARTSGGIDAALLAGEPIFKLTPFFEQMGPLTDGGRKEFFWEREWRHIGDYRIYPAQTFAILAPEYDHERFRRDLQQKAPLWADRPILDPRWGLESMLAVLSGLAPSERGPFPALG